jgi:hypothetical protein
MEDKIVFLLNPPDTLSMFSTLFSEDAEDAVLLNFEVRDMGVADLSATKDEDEDTDDDPDDDDAIL